MSIEKFEEVYNIVKPTLEKAGLTDEEIRNTLTKLFTPTSKEMGDMLKLVMNKINGK